MINIEDSESEIKPFSSLDSSANQSKSDRANSHRSKHDQDSHLTQVSTYQPSQRQGLSGSDTSFDYGGNSNQNPIITNRIKTALDRPKTSRIVINNSDIPSNEVNVQLPGRFVLF